MMQCDDTLQLFHSNRNGMSLNFFLLAKSLHEVSISQIKNLLISLGTTAPKLNPLSVARVDRKAFLLRTLWCVLVIGELYVGVMV